FRRVRSHRVDGLRSLVNRILRASPNHFRVVTGKKIIEVRPPVDWGKGNAVARLLKGHRGGSRRLVVFIGDDRTDEDAFAILRSRSITIRVGDVHNTSAQYTVRSTTEVRQVLRLLLRSFLQRTRGRA
ncbi:MAG: trehalose-phosphatase, partial [Bacteroidota bacterium]